MHVIYVELAIYGHDLYPDEVTRAIGIEPTVSWCRGDKRTRRCDMLHKEGAWKISSEKNSSSLESHIIFLKAIIAHRDQVIRKYAKVNCFSITIEAVVTLNDSSPDLSLNNEVLGWMYSLGADLDFDVYF